MRRNLRDEVLNFAGNGGEYIKLPRGLIEKESFAVEATFKTDTVANSWLWCLGTKVNSWPNVTNYVFVSPAFSEMWFVPASRMDRMKSCLIVRAVLRQVHIILFAWSLRTVT